ncbi:MAG TPA: hypothetical protein VFU85_00915 [Nocardioides sp.]|nr:hypothetical protein [Nocardioides sp.]
MPLLAQQAPETTMQGFGEQEVPLPWYTPPTAAQSVLVRTLQVPPWQQPPTAVAGV